MKKEAYHQRPEVKEKIKARFQAFYATPEGKKYIYEKNKERRNKNPEKTKAAERDSHLKRTYGISMNDYNRMYVEQDRKCLLCKNPCSSGRNLSVDHCHKTGKVRGLLCINCNQGLGKFKDNIELMKSAILYIENHNKSYPD
jgi:hypothetical protein